MKQLFLLFTLLLLLFQQRSFSQCNSGPVTITGNSLITGSCIITGDLTILNGATLDVDLTSLAPDTFVVRGNILLQGNAVLRIHAATNATGEQFIVSNNFNAERTITTQDSSKIQLEHIEFRTQEGNLSSAASIYMNYDALDNSILYVDRSSLDPETAWILFNMKNKSTLIGYETYKIPTETYIQDSAQVMLHGLNTDAGVWLTFDNVTDTLNLPPDQTQPYSWQIGRGAGGLNTSWYLELDTVQQVGMGVQIFPSAQMTINGAGFPATGELKVALMFANNTDTIAGLDVGLQNTTVTNGLNGSVTLNNVNLGPIAWQLYALMNENLYITNSIINEIGIAGPSNVTIDSSLLQLAVLAAVGVGGSTMTINNTEIWNQAITAANNSDITLNNCSVTGSAFSTVDALSNITVNGGCFFANPTGCTQATMVNITTGQPSCNPFIPPGFPQNLTPATVNFIGVTSNCVAGINENSAENNILIYPNPADEFLNIVIPEKENDVIQIQLFNAMGMLLQEISINKSTQINLADLPGGIYFLHVINDAQQTLRFIKQ